MQWPAGSVKAWQINRRLSKQNADGNRNSNRHRSRNSNGNRNALNSYGPDG